MFTLNIAWPDKKLAVFKIDLNDSCSTASYSVFEEVFINESLSNRAKIIKITEQTPVPKDIQVMPCLFYLVLY